MPENWWEIIVINGVNYEEEVQESAEWNSMGKCRKNREYRSADKVQRISWKKEEQGKWISLE